MLNHYINIGSQGNFTWESDIPGENEAGDLPITTLADYGFLPDNGLLTNKIINEYGSFVFKDIQARMYHSELKTEAGTVYRKDRSYWQALKDLSKRTEPSNLESITLSKKDKAIYTERELAEHMVQMVRLLQPVEMLLNQPNLNVQQIKDVLGEVKQNIEDHKGKIAQFRFSDLPGIDRLIEAEQKDLDNIIDALIRLEGRIKDTDNNAEIQKWLLKRFDQLNRGFEIRIRNVNIYKAAGNTGGLTLGRAYDTVQNVKKLFRLTGHYYAEAGKVTEEMQHKHDKHRAAFNSELYPLRKNSGDDQGNALKVAHYIAAEGDYTTAQANYRSDKDGMVKHPRKKNRRSPLKVISEAVINFGSSLKAKAIEERDFSFGHAWRSSVDPSEQKEALELLTKCLESKEPSTKIERDSKDLMDREEGVVPPPTLASQNFQPEQSVQEEVNLDISKNVQMQPAYPSGSLQLAAMGDIFTSTTKFTENFVEFFAEEFSDKRPFISVVAFSIYGLCGLTVFDPVLAKAVVGVATKAIEELATALAIQKITGSPVIINPEVIISAISKEAAAIAEHLGSNASMGAKLVTSSLVNMQGYVFTADLLGMPTNESGFIRDMIEAARTNHLTKETMLNAMERYGLNIGTAVVILGIGMAMGLFSSYISTHGVPLDKVFELPLHNLTNPYLAPGAAFNASLITLKSVGAFYEAVYTAGSEVSRSGVPIEKNDIDYALLVLFLSNDLQRKLEDFKEKEVIKNQLKRLLREYPGLIKHPEVKKVAEQFNCLPAKSSWGATLIWGLLKPVIIATTWVISIPRLAWNRIVHGKDSDGYRSALRSFVRGPLAGWLLLKRLATTGITFGRMLTRLAIEVPFRFVNKTMTLIDAAGTGFFKMVRKFGKSPADKKRLAEKIEADYVHRCQQRNSHFVSLIGWLDDNFAKPVTNVLFRNAEQTTQLLLATGTVTRHQRYEMYQKTIGEIERNKGKCHETTEDVFSIFQIDKDDKPHSPSVVPSQTNKKVPFESQHHTLSLFPDSQLYHTDPNDVEVKENPEFATRDTSLNKQNNQ